MSEKQKNTSDFDFRRASAIGAALVGVAVPGYLIAQAAGNALNEQKHDAQVHAEFEADDDFLKAVQEAAQQPADPLDIQDTFQITEETVSLVHSAESIVVNLEDYEGHEDLIDYTINQSALAQGIYHEGEEYAVTSAKIDGQDTYIVQPVGESED